MREIRALSYLKLVLGVISVVGLPMLIFYFWNSKGLIYYAVSLGNFFVLNLSPVFKDIKK